MVCVHRQRAADETWDGKKKKKPILSVCVIQARRGQSESEMKEREGEAAKESRHLRVTVGGGGVQTNPPIANRSCARSSNAKDSC